MAAVSTWGRTRAAVFSASGHTAANDRRPGNAGRAAVGGRAAARGSASPLAGQLAFWPIRLRPYMRVRSSSELRHRPGPFPLCQRLRARFGSRAVLSRSRSCITLHAVGSVAGPAPECLMHEAWPRQNTTHLKRGGLTLPMTKTVALPVSPPMIASPAAISPMPRARHPPAAARSGHSARARSAACAPSRRWRSAVCARPVRRRARETTRRARCRAGSAARARQAG